MKKFNYKKAIKKIEENAERILYKDQPECYYNQGLDDAIEIIKDNIKEYDIACPHLKENKSIKTLIEKITREKKVREHRLGCRINTHDEIRELGICQGMNIAIGIIENIL